MSDLQARLDNANICLSILKEKGRMGKGKLPRALSAYQVLDFRLDRDQLISKHGMPGHKSGSVFSAAQYVSKGLMLLERVGLVNFNYVTTKGTSFVVAGETITPGYEVFAYYQLTAEGVNCDHLEVSDKGGIVLINNDGVAFQVYAAGNDEREEVG